MRSFARFAWALLAYVVIVILWGAFVRATGSGAGCGDHWPMCNGELIPRIGTAKTLVELTHRVTSGLAWLMTFVLFVWSRRVYPRGSATRRGAAWVLVFMTLEALIGAGIVLLEMVASNVSVARAAWMATHLLNTFALLLVMTLTARSASGGASMSVKKHAPLAWAFFAAMLGMALLGASGAVAALGDTVFPSTSLAHGLRQDFSEAAHLFIRLRVLHPIFALTVGLLVIVAAVSAMRSQRDRTVRRLGLLVVIVYCAQLALGLLNVALLAPVWLQLMHLALADILWISLILLGAEALSRPARSRAREASELDVSPERELRSAPR